MKIAAPTLTLSLRKDAHLRLQDALGTTLRVVRGTLWVTQAGDRIDHIVEPGSAYTLDRNGATVISAESDAEFRLETHRVTRSAATVAHLHATLEQIRY